MSQDVPLLHSPLDAFHREHGARMIEFAGWEMPLQFSGIVTEHLAVRRAAGLFDISHMGQIRVSGKTALQDLQRIVTKDLAPAKPGRAVYSLLCNEEGGILDDIIVYRMAENEFFIIVNAVNATKDFEWLKENSSKTTELENLSTSRALFAMQGPNSSAIVGQLTSQPLSDLRYFRFRSDMLRGFPVILARTGYTGEDGFEISVESDDAVDLWNCLLEAGKPFELKLLGLGARDTLRLEMAYSLYGMEISESVSPFEAGLQKAVSLKKTDFIGRDAIIRRGKESRRTLIGLELLNRSIPRPHFRVKSGAGVVGKVTSGTMSPSLGRGIALAFVEKKFSEIGTVLDVEIRGVNRCAIVVRTPFWTPRVYTRSSAAAKRSASPGSPES
ncbi:glycine cleavage system aminomethyltransferase GcvT [bacterium]|nr:glycine cleavage system aminomethyltransferase GcvT [bacterium]